MTEAFGLVGRAERESAVLSGLLHRGRPRLFRIDGSVAFATDAAAPADHQDLPPTGGAPTLWAPVAADLVRLGRPDQKLRARAFYEDGDVSLVAHGRLRDPWPRRATLHRGADIQERIGAHSGFVLSRVLERGRGYRHAWLVEERLMGRPLEIREWQAMVPRVLDGLAGMWLAGGVRHVPLDRIVPSAAAASVLAIVARWPDPEVDGFALAERARRILEKDGLVALGWCHGDPVRTNFLLLPDGRLALVDWEGASRRALAHDATKTMFEIDDPRAQAEELASRLKAADAPRSLPWHEQMALATLARLGRSRRRARLARTLADPRFEDMVVAARRRNIRLLAPLLEG